MTDRRRSSNSFEAGFEAGKQEAIKLLQDEINYLNSPEGVENRLPSARSFAVHVLLKVGKKVAGSRLSNQNSHESLL